MNYWWFNHSFCQQVILYQFTSMRRDAAHWLSNERCFTGVNNNYDEVGQCVPCLWGNKQIYQHIKTTAQKLLFHLLSLTQARSRAVWAGLCSLCSPTCDVAAAIPTFLSNHVHWCCYIVHWFSCCINLCSTINSGSIWSEFVFIMTLFIRLASGFAIPWGTITGNFFSYFYK